MAPTTRSASTKPQTTSSSTTSCPETQDVTAETAAAAPATEKKRKNTDDQNDDNNNNSNGDDTIVHWTQKELESTVVSYVRKIFEQSNVLIQYASQGNTKAFISYAEGLERTDVILNVGMSSVGSILHCAATSPTPGVAEWILSDTGRKALGFKDVLKKDNSGCNALLCSIDKGNLETAKAIVKGCKIKNGEREEMLNSTDESDWTAAHVAAWDGKAASFNWLMSEPLFHRENLFRLTEFKESVLCLAVTSGSIDCVDAVLGACDNNNEESKLLLGRDENGWTILHRAVRGCDPEMIRHLLRYYPEEMQKIVNAVDHFGLTPLHIAVVAEDEATREDRKSRDEFDLADTVAALLGMNVYEEYEEMEDEEEEEDDTDDDEEGEDNKFYRSYFRYMTREKTTVIAISREPQTKADPNACSRENIVEMKSKIASINNNPAK